MGKARHSETYHSEQEGSRNQGCIKGVSIVTIAVTSESKTINLNDFQVRAAKTDRNPESGISGVHFALLGLFGEVGSVLSELKKKQRDRESYFAYTDSVVEEFGDALWYFSNIAGRCGLQLGSIARSAFRELGTWDEPRSADPTSFEDLQKGVSLEGPLSGSITEAGLIALAGKVGRLLDDFAAKRIEQNRDVLSGHLIDIFRALIQAANDAGISLAACARHNLAKIASRWPTIKEYGPLFDQDDDQAEQIPRRIEIDIRERIIGTKRYVRMQCNKINIGDPLTDNKETQDDYRFHDVFHFANAAVLGWSPVIRALFRVKRKSRPIVDETQDGARAILIEEGIATWVFNHACRLNYFEGIQNLDYSLLKAIRELVTGYEVESRPLWQWEQAVLQGYSVFRMLRKNRSGVIVADLEERRISYREA
jgi:NTP pyrophosphatase (non-canonical NTP hydrolase)